MTFRQGAAVFSGVLGVSLAGLPAAWAQMTPPPVGAKYTFECSSSVNANYEEVYSIVASDGTKLRVEVDDGIDRNWYEKPLYLLNTTIATRQEIRGKTASMFDVPSEFAQLQSLEIGGKYKGYVVERRPKERLEWNYTLSVLGRETVYNRAFGDLKVITLSENRWVNVYSSSLDVRYAPALNFPLGWEYEDSNGAQVTCELAAAEGVQGIPVAGQTAADTQERTQVAVISSPQRMRSVTNANVREEPSRAAARIGRLGSGTQVSVSGYVDVSGERWYALPLDNGTTGYIFSSLLQGAGAETKQAAAAPAPKPVTPSPQSSPAQKSTQTAAFKAPEPKPAPAPATASSSERLKKLDELRRLDLISESEYQAKRKDLLGSGKSVGIAEQLRQTNTKFRRGEMNPEEFVQARAGILAKINAQDMDAKQGLVLLNDLINERLISEAEYSRKRATMLDAL